MNDELSNDILMIWLLRRLDLSEAKKDMINSYGEPVDNDEVSDMSKQAIVLYMLEIPDRYELPHPVHNLHDFKLLHYEPF